MSGEMDKGEIKPWMDYESTTDRSRISMTRKMACGVRRVRMLGRSTGGWSN